MEQTLIEWAGTRDAAGVLQAGYTFNPWLGCTKVSPACFHCYAETLVDKRFGRVEWGRGNPRSRTSDANWKQPLKWSREAAKFGARRKVFCASLADVFDAEVDPAWRNDLWALVRATSWLDWLILTKRPENVPGMLPVDWNHGYSNVWLGTSVENQHYANLRIPRLTAVPAVVHFLSVEPLLGPIKFNTLDDIEWVIVGGESGHGARPMMKDWVVGIREQLTGARVPFFFKQWGEFNEQGVKTGKKKAGHELDGVTYHEFPTVPAARLLELHDEAGA
jgi:protein gp37